MPFKNSQQRKAAFANMRNKTYNKYKKSTNMNSRRLLVWSKNPCSRKASLSREPIKRNLILLKKPKIKWTRKDVKGAKRTILFIKRHKGQPRGKSRGKGCPSGRVIALKNWGYNPRKR